MGKRIKYTRIPEEDFINILTALNGANSQVSKLISLVKVLYSYVLKHKDNVVTEYERLLELQDRAEDLYENRFVVALDVKNKFLKISNHPFLLSDRDVQVLETVFKCYINTTVANYAMFGLEKEALKHVVKRINHRFNLLFQITSIRGIGYTLDVSPKALDDGCKLAIENN